ncbi:MAG TPA: twin-arginine translocase TatA/TatE family subunit [Fimbriimonadaceae bacterium]|nr:twin-arginine translocase TatA/TatE family subunit [Fimbriimonadaceae bacterium]HRJ32838.1 twin-arginine translocase TatA/TatE family subunit [Fimbriimonadaceae bacterium]
MLAFIGTNELIIVVVVVLLLFGGTKIPQLMRGVGRGVGELQKGLEEGKRALSTSAQDDEDDVKTASPKTSS